MFSSVAARLKNKMATESFNIQRRPLFVNTKLTTLALLVDSGSLSVFDNRTGQGWQNNENLIFLIFVD